MTSIYCPGCNSALALTELPYLQGPVQCRRCSQRLELRVFPAVLGDPKKAPPALAEPPAEGEAACFYSPNRKATKDCTHCGVLISDMWAAQWGNGTVCLRCLDHLREQNKDSRFEMKRTLWDSITLAVACIPLTLIFYWAAFVTAPAAVILGIWSFRRPRSLIRPGPWRMLFAITFALVQILGMALAFREIMKAFQFNS